MNILTIGLLTIGVIAGALGLLVGGFLIYTYRDAVRREMEQ